MSNGDTDSPIDPEKQFRATLTRSIFTVPTTRLLQKPPTTSSGEPREERRAAVRAVRVVAGAMPSTR